MRTPWGLYFPDRTINNSRYFEARTRFCTNFGIVLRFLFLPVLLLLRGYLGRIESGGEVQRAFVIIRHLFRDASVRQVRVFVRAHARGSRSIG